ncbi:hypothetical protein C469_00755 [Halorubrum lipolyticum DSM 21995]|uniref:Uncharacterized protein n=1 Tax=Halorubrum lipolyticum DSM 21995 TaxID=1227482 RepID=M0P3S1_9EURY|nr:hypothetical protein C469_00755 [Halorubrum lipolyticum DSM 21995]
MNVVPAFLDIGVEDIAHVSWETDHALTVEAVLQRCVLVWPVVEVDELLIGIVVANIERANTSESGAGEPDECE